MAMVTMIMEEEYTATEGMDLTNRHVISVSGPSGQYFDKASRAVNGIVMLKRRSNAARWATRISLVFSVLAFVVPPGRRVLDCRYSDKSSRALQEKDAMVKHTYNPI